MDKINEVIDRIPISLLLALYLGYVGFDYYTFENDKESPKHLKIQQVESEKKINDKYRSKIKEMEVFVKTLEQKKVELRALAKELQDAKTSISDNVDVPEFIKLIMTEAKKLNMTVISLKPTGQSSKEFYAEYTFNLQFHGAFIQLLSFLNRVSNLNRIIQVDDYSITAKSHSGKFMMLEGDFELKIFKYLGTKADNLGKS